MVSNFFFILVGYMMFVGLTVDFEFYRGSDGTNWRVRNVKR